MKHEVYKLQDSLALAYYLPFATIDAHHVVNEQHVPNEGKFVEVSQGSVRD